MLPLVVLVVAVVVVVLLVVVVVVLVVVVVVLSIAAAVVAASYLAIKSTNQLWAILGHSPACRNLASIPSLVWHRAYVSVFSEPLSAAEVAAGKVLLVSGDSPTFGRAMAA